MRPSSPPSTCAISVAPADLRAADADAARAAAPVLAGAAATPQWQAALQRGPQAAQAFAAQCAGDFAVGLQGAEPRCSFGAVDRFALQTLCYTHDGPQLRFAARADALAGADAEIDPQALFDYLFFHCIPSPRTVFKRVQRVPAAHTVVLQGGQVTLTPYWRPQFDAPRATPPLTALRAEFRALLKAAVGRQLDSGPAACFLSGGTDSSTVAGMIREVTGRGAEAYSIGFEAEGYDEMAYARLAAQHFGAQHHAYYVTPDDLVRSIPAVAASFDQPFGNSSVLPAYYCALQARQNGVTKLLAGDGGDELFGGNSRYAKQRVFGYYNRVPQALRSAVVEPFFGLPAVARTPLLKKGSSYVEQARVAMPGRLQMYNLLLRLGVAEVLDSDFLRQIDTTGPARHQQQTWGWAADGASELNRTLAYDWRYTLAESDLPKVRGAAQLAGIEVGYPMLDAELLAFSLRLPDDYKLKGLTLRWFFKDALRGFLPDAIIRKKKQGFGLPFGPWTLRHDGLRRLATDSLGSLSTRGIVRPAFIRELLDRRLAEHPGYFGEMVWILMMLEQWLQHHAPAYRAAGRA